MIFFFFFWPKVVVFFFTFLRWSAKCPAGTFQIWREIYSSEMKMKEENKKKTRTRNGAPIGKVG
jgi:hypothetical protein